MEPFHHLPPAATTRKTPSPYSPPRRSELQSVTSEWLSLTLDPSSPTLVPPTLPPLPSHSTPFMKAPSSSSSQADFSVEPRELSRIPHFKHGRQSLDHFPHISAPLPYLIRSSPSPDSSLRCTGEGTAKTCHISKPELLFCTEPEPVRSPTADHPQHSLKNSHPSATEPYEELLSMILQGCSGQDEPVIAETHQSMSNPKGETPNPPTAGPSGARLARASAGAGHSREHVRANPVSPTGTDPPQTHHERVVKFQRPPVVKRSSYTELFIEEEEESAREKEEEVLGCRERAPPQVEHGVCRICQVQGGK